MIHTHTQVCTYAHKNTLIHIHIYINSQTHTHLTYKKTNDKFMRACMYQYIHAYIHTYMMYVYMHAYIHTYIPFQGGLLPPDPTYAYIYRHARV